MRWSRSLLATALSLSPALLCAQSREPVETEARAAPTTQVAVAPKRCPMTLVMAALIASAERRDAQQKQRATAPAAEMPGPSVRPSPHAATTPPPGDAAREQVAVQAGDDQQ